jgi:anaerobic ribonucleoside-triphosphate reductase activating protein
MDFFNLMGETYPTTVNGPGSRYLIHLQGCNLGCKGCINPESWSFKLNKRVNVKQLAEKIINIKPEGLSISGGEPFIQSLALLKFLEYINDANLPKGVLIFSGYTEEELKLIPEYESILVLCDVIISGRYEESKRVYDSMLSSSNQKFIWGNKHKRITEKDLMNQDFEVVVENNQLTLTGFPEISKDMAAHLKDLGVEISYKN